MSSIKKGVESFIIKCAQCEHTQLSHTNRTVRDQSRTSSSKPYLTKCKECDCEEFKTKPEDTGKGLSK